MDAGRARDGGAGERREGKGGEEGEGEGKERVAYLERDGDFGEGEGEEAAQAAVGGDSGGGAADVGVYDVSEGARVDPAIQ